MFNAASPHTRSDIFVVYILSMFECPQTFQKRSVQKVDHWKWSDM